MKTPPPTTDITNLPFMLNLRDVSGLIRQSPTTIRRKLQQGTFRPMPWELNPLLWKRDDLFAYLNRTHGDGGPNGHGPGFVARARSQAKASLTSARGRGKKKAS